MSYPHYTDSLDMNQTTNGSLTPLEENLQLKHGDLHTIIPTLMTEYGTLAATAAYLGVSHSWLSKWLTGNGYRKVSRWERA